MNKKKLISPKNRIENKYKCCGNCKHSRYLVYLSCSKKGTEIEPNKFCDLYKFDGLSLNERKQGE